MSLLYDKTESDHPVLVGNREIQEHRIVRTLTDPTFPIDALVIDTFSELSKKYQRNLTRDDGGTMKISSWGKLKNKMDGLLEYLTALPGIVICNCHSKIQTMDTGGNKVLPYIDGSTKEDVSKWFDFVFYATTVNHPNGTNTYVWRTNHTSLYDHAKDRTQLLDNEIPQDYQVVINAANKRGYDGAKILVIGSPGTGNSAAAGSGSRHSVRQRAGATAVHRRHSSFCYQGTARLWPSERYLRPPPCRRAAGLCSPARTNNFAAPELSPERS